MEIINSFLLVGFTVFIITQSYRYYQFTWPEKYFGPEEKENVFISINPLYYLSFRILPVVIISFVILGTFYKANVPMHNPVILGMLIGIFYSLNNDGRALRDLILKSKNIEIFLNTTSQYVVHIIVVILLVLACTMSGYLSTFKSVHWILPKIDGLVDNIWAFFITILISYLLYKWVKKPKETPIDEIISKSIKDLSPETSEYIDSLAEKKNADPVLVKAIWIAENIERPKWIRRIENAIGLIKRKGTYGVMQVANDKPLSDDESIKKSISNFFVGTADMDFEAKKKSVERYNPNEKYIYLIEEIYRFINPEI